MDVVEEPWRAKAKCAGHPDPELWYPHRGSLYQAARAKAICRKCEVREDCLTVALTRDEDGIWGGLDEMERYRMRTTWRRRSQGERRKYILACLDEWMCEHVVGHRFTVEDMCAEYHIPRETLVYFVAREASKGERFANVGLSRTRDGRRIMTYQIVGGPR